MNKLINDFSAYLQEERMRAETTIKRYVGVLEEFALFLQHQNPNEGVELERVEKEALVKFLRKGHLKPGVNSSRSLWNIRLSSLRSFYSYLFNVSLIDINPALRIELLKTNPKEPVPLSLDELLALLEAVQKSRQKNQTRNVALVNVLFH